MQTAVAPKTEVKMMTKTELIRRFHCTWFMLNKVIAAGGLEPQQECGKT